MNVKGFIIMPNRQSSLMQRSITLQQSNEKYRIADATYRWQRFRSLCTGYLPVDLRLLPCSVQTFTHLFGHMLNYVAIDAREATVYQLHQTHVFCNRIINIWNGLPSDTTDFSSFLKFRRSVSNEYLAQHCKLNCI